MRAIKLAGDIEPPVFDVDTSNEFDLDDPVIKAAFEAGRKAARDQVGVYSQYLNAELCTTSTDFYFASFETSG